jgi:hypothetical protein
MPAIRRASRRSAAVAVSVAVRGCWSSRRRKFPLPVSSRTRGRRIAMARR